MNLSDAGWVLVGLAFLAYWELSSIKNHLKDIAELLRQQRRERLFKTIEMRKPKESP